MQRRRWLGFLAAATLAVAVLAALIVASGGYGYRWGWWDLGDGFRRLLQGFYVGCAAIGLALIALALGLIFRRRGVALLAFIALLIGAATISLPINMRLRAQNAPRIHDITTDFANPPAFVALKNIRNQLPNGATYGGSVVADQQRAAYGDIGPVLLKLPPSQAMAKARQVAQDMGWQIVTADASQLEATATTPWFGFKDDIVLRVSADGAGSRIDIRSASRIGTSDLGANARRVRDTIERLKAQP